MAVRAGSMRHRVRIQSRTVAQDSTGEPFSDWVDFAIRFASVEPLVGKEFFASQTRNARVQTRFRLRYLAGVTPAMRIVFDGRVFDITDVTLVRAVKHEMVVMADEIVGQLP